MGAEVKLRMATTDYQVLQVLLRYLAHQITEDQFKSILVSMGYKAMDPKVQIPYLAEQLGIAIQ